MSKSDTMETLGIVWIVCVIAWFSFKIYRKERKTKEWEGRAKYLLDTITEEQLFSQFKNWQAVLQNGEELIKIKGSECQPLVAKFDYRDCCWLIWLRSKSNNFFTIKCYADPASNILSLDEASLKLERKESVLSMLMHNKRMDLIDCAGFVQKDA